MVRAWEWGRHWINTDTKITMGLIQWGQQRESTHSKNVRKNDSDGVRYYYQSDIFVIPPPNTSTLNNFTSSLGSLLPILSQRPIILVWSHRPVIWCSSSKSGAIIFSWGTLLRLSCFLWYADLETCDTFINSRLNYNNFLSSGLSSRNRSKSAALSATHSKSKNHITLVSTAPHWFWTCF